MNAIITLVKKELLEYFISPVAYIFISAFLILAGIIFSSNVFLQNQAEMRRLFELLPVLLILFTSAITMSSWSEERKQGTLELLATQKLTPTQLIISKFLSSWMLVVFSILLTFPIPLILNLLGNPDNGVIIGGYIGLIIASAAYVLIGQFISINSNSQITAFILSVLMIGILYTLGEAEIYKYIPRSYHSLLSGIGIASHFKSIAKGVVDTRDISYFALLIALMLFFIYTSYGRIKQLGR